MALTKDFRETIRDWAPREPAFRKALLREAIELMLSGDERTGRPILRPQRHLPLLPRRITSHRNRRYLARRPPKLLTNRWGGSRAAPRSAIGVKIGSSPGMPAELWCRTAIPQIAKTRVVFQIRGMRVTRPSWPDRD
jgi:hypothetical protein